jgi:anti-anti-sigma regulatory factor
MIAPVRQQVPLPQLSARDRGGVTVASLRAELDFAALPALQAYLSDNRCRGRPRCVIDLTALAFTDCARARCPGRELASVSGSARARAGAG